MNYKQGHQSILTECDNFYIQNHRRKLFLHEKYIMGTERSQWNFRGRGYVLGLNGNQLFCDHLIEVTNLANGHFLKDDHCFRKYHKIKGEAMKSFIKER